MSKELEDVIKFMLSDEVIKAVNNVKTTPEFEAMIQAIRKELVRPEESMGLGEKLYKAYPNWSKYEIGYENMAEIARAHYFSSENEKALAEMIRLFMYERVVENESSTCRFAKRDCEWFRDMK